MRIKTGIIATSAVLLVAAACAGQPETIEVEVTREVPVTVAIPQTVAVTREVPVTQEVPVTVVVPRTVEVTRQVSVPQTVEVTREVPVTRATMATPTPVVAPTASPTDAPTPAPTPTPTMAPTVSPTPTPTPAPPETTQFGSWTMEDPEHYGSREIHKFENVAIDQQTGDQPPVLTYQCDTRGGRTMYIEWRHPITAESSGSSQRLTRPVQPVPGHPLLRPPGIRRRAPGVCGRPAIYAQGTG